jgi:hypothetical protein
MPAGKSQNPCECKGYPLSDKHARMIRDALDAATAKQAPAA